MPCTLRFRKLSFRRFFDIVRQRYGGVGVVSALSINVLDCVQPILNKNGLFVFKSFANHESRSRNTVLMGVGFLFFGSIRFTTHESPTRF